MNLFIYGSGGTGCEIADIVHRINQRQQQWEQIRFVDDVREEREYYGMPVLRFDDMLREQAPFECVIAQGEPRHRRTLHDKVTAAGVALARVIDPGATVSPSADIAPGCVIWPGVFVSSLTRLEANVIVQINSVIGHDAVLGAHSVISSGVSVGGASVVGQEAFVGMGATVKEKIQVGDHAIVGMGASLFTSLEPGLVALGNPARAMVQNVDRKVFK
ncbi:NeuD/PglB/VioB family sugar acetyltransferase [Herbaspirillum sp. LeCh32-8]|uniref:NeuD/PglB/VioB family sugar acetyltransferase n=1 Tax=Herbaspirillum sp. LeCh32-8 TaxID=2821356 RepID=UPI001AE42FEF|nr:NeuD/PglB/VioB family sugar acetyltransferase [Herbaspirillum sp. LeCh32-8]MBP0600706.1 NeuD/PglB/VioB family sugar acetyltransferase [Herbaspirillum sp. LeCh32-8]